MLRIGCLIGLIAVVTANVLPVIPERRLGDAEFLKRQKQVLNLYVGIGHSQHFKNEWSDYDISANMGAFTDEKYPREFWAAYKRGFTPREGIFSLACHHTFHDTMKLFDLLYFAKDFDTFYSVASWARSHIHPAMFAYAYTVALLQRPDTQNYVIPPLYEFVPNYFVPMDTLHQIYDFKMMGRKEGRFSYNNSGYEYNYHGGMFGGALNVRNGGYGDIRVAYFREDIGLNSFFARFFSLNPSWMCPHKYNRGVRFSERRGENFYYTLQQIFARYTLERLSNGLPFVTVLSWSNPIQVGYNPRVTYMNGQSMYVRPDNVIPNQFNLPNVMLAEHLERRTFDVVDAGTVWELSNNSLIRLNEENGVEILGRIIYGTTDRPSRSYYKSLYYAGIDALAYLFDTGSDRSYIGNAMSSPITALRDPAFYNYIARLLLPFQRYKRSLGPYQREDLIYNGVTIQNVEVDKLLTYFEMSDYEVTNAVPMEQPEDYTQYRYNARQYRLNHKPYRYNISVQSESAGDAIVRVFIGPKYDAEDRLLTYDQARLAYFEIDRFPVKLNAGANVLERNSIDSPIFINDQDGFRSLYSSINNALNQKEQFYIYEGGRCGLPERLQLPMGWHGGRQYIFSVVISSFDRSHTGDEKSANIACGGSRLYDGRAMGYPFDRPIRNDEFSGIPNIFLRDIQIYHKEAADINRPSA